MILSKVAFNSISQAFYALSRQLILLPFINSNFNSIFSSFFLLLLTIDFVLNVSATSLADLYTRKMNARFNDATLILKLFLISSLILIFLSIGVSFYFESNILGLLFFLCLYSLSASLFLQKYLMNLGYFYVPGIDFIVKFIFICLFYLILCFEEISIDKILGIYLAAFSISNIITVAVFILFFGLKHQKESIPQGADQNLIKETFLMITFYLGISIFARGEAILIHHFYQLEDVLIFYAIISFGLFPISLIFSSAMLNIYPIFLKKISIQKFYLLLIIGSFLFSAFFTFYILDIFIRIFYPSFAIESYPITLLILFFSSIGLTLRPLIILKSDLALNNFITYGSFILFILFMILFPLNYLYSFLILSLLKIIQVIILINRLDLNFR